MNAGRLQKSIFGGTAEIPFANGQLNFTAISQSQHTNFTRPPLGFEPAGAGTKVTLTQTGWQQGKEWDEAYEYLAMGRPVVSTTMRALSMEEAGRVIAFAGNPADFCRQIERCLTTEIQSAVQERRAAVVNYSWDAIFARLDAACGNALTR